jgi:hypothetical protein
VDWCSDVCSSDLALGRPARRGPPGRRAPVGRVARKLERGDRLETEEKVAH